MTTSLPLKIDKLREHAASVGLSLVGVLPVDLSMQSEVTRLATWQAAGFAGEMGFMQRDPGLFAAPRNLLANAKSIVLFAIPYARAPTESCPPGYGRVARYAWGRDYHRVLKKRLLRLVASVSRDLTRPIQARAFSDAVPFLERAYAKQAGLGFIGKNSLLIRPQLGSFFFIGEIIWDLECELQAEDLPRGHCGPCRNCLDTCPTSAFVSEYQLDARRCISYLTIEKVGMFSAWERAALGEWVFGCDRCQEVCPFNHRGYAQVADNVLSEFEPSRGAGPFLPLADILDMRSEDCFRARFQGTALMRPGREGLLRNAAVVAANTRSESLIPALRSAFLEDSSAVVRAKALWALSKMDSGNGLVDRALADLDPLVQEEARAIAETGAGDCVQTS